MPFRSTPGKVCERPRGQRPAFLSTALKEQTRREAMGHAAHHHKINYIEFSSTDTAKTKAFYSAVFGWSFQDWGPDYVGFSSDSGGMDGGFAKVEAGGGTGKSGPLVVLYSADLKATEAAVVAAGGSIIVPAFEFPGGRRFHFSDGAGNVLAVWSE
jgi:predicted enzyme related to lactoylglutathione lyase